MATSGAGIVIFSPKSYFNFGPAIMSENVVINQSNFNPGLDSLSERVRRPLLQEDLGKDLATRQACGLGNGGAMCIQLGQYQVVLSTLTITRNQATNGAGVYVDARDCRFGNALRCGIVQIGQSPDYNTGSFWHNKTTILANNTAIVSSPCACTAPQSSMSA